MSHVGHNCKVPIRIHTRYLQIIIKFAKCGPACEGKGKWIMDYGILPVRADPSTPPASRVTLYRYKSSPKIFFLCFAATQLARQVQQERTQVVCSNEVVQKRLARRHSRNSCHMFVFIVNAQEVDTHSILKYYFLDLS